jgi:hypothetical protein
MDNRGGNGQEQADRPASAQKSSAAILRGEDV